jgi:uncharacterized membrane protein
MEAILMSAGILTAIILCVVGLVKLPFESFKAKHPKWYKTIFTLLSIVLTFGAVIINQLYILNDKLFTTNFYILLFSTYTGVLGLYTSYEGFHLKEYIAKLLEAIKSLQKVSPTNKFIKYLDKIDIDQAIELVNAKKESQVLKADEIVIENKEVANQVINAEHVEINNAENTNN